MEHQLFVGFVVARLQGFVEQVTLAVGIFAEKNAYAARKVFVSFRHNFTLEVNGIVQAVVGVLYGGQAVEETRGICVDERQHGIVVLVDKAVIFAAFYKEDGRLGFVVPPRLFVHRWNAPFFAPLGFHAVVAVLAPAFVFLRLHVAR